MTNPSTQMTQAKEEVLYLYRLSAPNALETWSFVASSLERLVTTVQVNYSLNLIATGQKPSTLSSFRGPFSRIRVK